MLDTRVCASRPMRFALAAITLTLAACGGSDDDAQVQVAGAVDRPSALSAPQLQYIGNTTQTDTFVAGTTAQTHTYTGANLWTLLNQAGIQVAATRKNDVLGKYLLATGADGYRSVFSLGEIDPDFGNRASIVAFAETTNGVSNPLGSDGPFRVTAPGDVKGGRYVSELVRVDLRPSGSSVASTGGGVSTSLAVSGAVQHSGSFDLAALQALPVTTSTVGTTVYTGVSLWTFLSTTVGLVTNPAVKNDELGLYVVATGSDGYQAVFAMGELDPSFGAQPDLIAYASGGVPLTTTGFARIVVPNDVKAGRYVSNLISIEVFAAAP